MSRSMFACVLHLLVIGQARAALHAGLAVNKAGKPKPTWPDAPVVSATGPVMENLRTTGRHDAVEHEACTGLKSVGGNMYTVGVNVGTPEQMIDVVVDTGSNLLIVEDCQCKDRGYCAAYNKCFREEQSSTLSVSQGPKGPAKAILNFGSGSILTKVASDSVRIGSTRTNMDRGVLLMVDMALDFGGPFEGILGLGLPNSKDGPLALRISQHKSFFDGYIQDQSSFPTTVRMNAEHNGKPFVPTRMPTDTRNRSLDNAAHRAASRSNRAGLEDKRVSHRIKEEPIFGGGFLRQAGISRFSLCFTESSGEGLEPDGGVLRFDPPEGLEPLKSIGTMHWGLDFQGISVGAASEKLPFCSADEMQASQKTACGAIPDSGTTYIMGPQNQIDMMFEALCDQWPRCRRYYAQLFSAAETEKSAAAVQDYLKLNQKGIKPLSKAGSFVMLLQDCDSWMEEPLGINEVPPIHFHVGDDTGRTKALKVNASFYTVSIQEPERKEVTVKVPGLGEVPIGWKETGRTIWMCKPAFESLDYPTEYNGPAWIIGMPLFHQHTVGFNVAVEPPTISFTEGQCGSCGNSSPSLLGDDAATASGPRSALRPHRVRGKPRLPKVDTAQPF